ncbi:hypothetical protein C8R46DRAFT_270025 [Mycena filopes]|nr:hypothetical protein C8R46DRAFT_270025 [Mycena filopes]
MLRGSSPAFRDPPTQRPPNNWGDHLPSPVPSTSLNSHFPMTRPSSPTSSAFGQFSQWPQIFKMNPGTKFEPKKPRLSCFFCRERKIGCTRPEVDAADQTCNQCAKRKRQCVYPTRSRRGQHTRRRPEAASTTRLGLNETTIPQVTPPNLL